MNLTFTSQTAMPADLHQRLKTTTGRCLDCHKTCPAEVWTTASASSPVHYKRTCPEHGEQWSVLSSDARFYWPSIGAEKGSDCSASSSNCCDSAPDTIEALSTCLALIEIVDSCNLKCPTCFADSLPGIGPTLDYVPIEEIKTRVQDVIDRKGSIEILQFSGGEPTLHPQFFELVEWSNANPGIDYLLINTNGVRLATDNAFLEQLELVVNYGHMQVYLQFDGTREEGQQTLRGTDLRDLKQKAVERCNQIGLPLTLAMTVIPENLDQLWETIDFGLRYPHIRGVSFQPMFDSGRNNMNESTERRLNVADIILGAVEQSGGKLKFEDFTPLPCGDPNCATIGYLLKIGGTVRSISDFIDFREVQGFLQDRLRYQLDDLRNCGCESQPLGVILKQFELDESHTFRLFIKPFMDAQSWDDDRIDRCCTHVIRPDGKLDSFCRYYSGFADCKA